MIPTMMLFGAIFGRWWAGTLLVAAIGWPLVLYLDGTLGLGPQLLVAAALAAANAFVGILLHQVVRWAVGRARRVRRSDPRIAEAGRP